MTLSGADPQRLLAAAEALDRAAERAGRVRRGTLVGTARATAAWTGAAAAQFDRTSAAPAARFDTAQRRLGALATDLRTYAGHLRLAQEEEQVLRSRRDELHRRLVALGGDAATQAQVRREIAVIDRRLGDLEESARRARSRFRVAIARGRPTGWRVRTGPVGRVARLPLHKMRTGPVGQIARIPGPTMGTGPVGQISRLPVHKMHPQPVTGVVTTT